MKFYGDIDLQKNVLKNVAFETLTDFPPDPVAGQTVFKNKKLYLCSEIHGQPVWIPMTNEIDSLVHVQDVAATVWVIDNTFSDNNVMVQVFDETGSVIIPESIEFGLLASEITFGSAQAGRAVIIHRIQDGTSGGGSSGSFGGANAMTDLTDVLLGTLQDGDVIIWDSVQSKWVSGTALTVLQSTVAAKAALNGDSSIDFAAKDLTLAGDVTVAGSMTVNGTSTTVNSQTVTTEDNIIVLNDGEPGAGVTAGFSGIEVDRGSQPNYQIVFNEALDMFQVGEIGDLETLASQNYVQAYAATINHVHTNERTDVIFPVYGKPTAAESVCRFRVSQAFTIPANLTGSIASAEVAATVSSDFIIKKNNVQVATVTFGAGSTAGTFSTQAAIVFNVTDKFEVLAPATQDTTLSDIDFSLVATLN